jgi:hypothetical protein
MSVLRGSISRQASVSWCEIECSSPLSIHRPRLRRRGLLFSLRQAEPALGFRWSVSRRISAAWLAAAGPADLHASFSDVAVAPVRVRVRVCPAFAMVSSQFLPPPHPLGETLLRNRDMELARRSNLHSRQA